MSAILTAGNAKACCTCTHFDVATSECHNPRNRWGMVYRDESGTREHHVEWWKVGAYGTCKNYEVEA
jgi:hypothetical protein